MLSSNEVLLPVLDVVAPARPPAWHVLWTHSNSEKLVADQLAAKGFSIFLPTLDVWTRRGGSRPAPEATRAHRGRPTDVTSSSSRIGWGASSSSPCSPTGRSSSSSPGARARPQVLLGLLAFRDRIAGIVARIGGGSNAVREPGKRSSTKEGPRTCRTDGEACSSWHLCWSSPSSWWGVRSGPRRCRRAPPPRRPRRRSRLRRRHRRPRPRR